MRHHAINLTCAGIRTPFAFLKGQHPRLRRFGSAEVESNCQRCASSLILLRSKRERVIAAPRLDPRVKPRRCIRYIRQGRPIRLLVTTKTVIPRASASYTILTRRDSRLCIRIACQRDILGSYTATEHRLVVWKRRHQYSSRRQFPCTFLP